MGVIRKLKDEELIGGTQSTDIYPVTAFKAVYNEENRRLDEVLGEVDKNITTISKDLNSKADTSDVEQAIKDLNSKIGDRNVIEGDVTNNPDEEDITTRMVNEKEVLSIKDRAYNPLQYSGKGYKILRKNIQDDKNVLIQDLFDEPNTVYEIRYDFDLNGDTITVPDNSTLKFSGGKLKNGVISGNNIFFQDTNIEDIEIQATIGNSQVTDSEVQNMGTLTAALKNENILVIDLQGKTISSYEMVPINIDNARQVIIKNGGISILGDSRLKFAENSTVIFENLTIKCSESSIFVQSLDTIRNSYSFINCTFGSNTEDVLFRYVYGFFKELVFKRCKFYNTSFFAATHSKDDTGFEPSHLMIIEDCYFEYFGTKNYGNKDCLNFGVIENIFIKNNTFVNINYTCIDAYCSSKYIITNNKFISCANCIELKSIYRNQDNISEGKGTGEYERCLGAIISGNYFENNNTSINLVLIDQTTDGGAYLSEKLPIKQKLGIVITNNIFVYNKDEVKHYAILGCGFKDVIISGNSVYSTNPEYMFYRESEVAMNYISNNIVISDNIFHYGKLNTLYYPIISLYTPSTYKIANNIIYGEIASNSGILINANSGNGDMDITFSNNKASISLIGTNSGIKVTVNDTSNLKFYQYCSKATIILNNCHDVVVYSSTTSLVYLACFNSSGVFNSQNSANKCICDFNSYFRSSGYDYRKAYDYKTIKQFDTLEELKIMKIPVVEGFVYDKDNVLYRFIPGNSTTQGWYDFSGNKLV